MVEPRQFFDPFLYAVAIATVSFSTFALAQDGSSRVGQPIQAIDRSVEAVEADSAGTTGKEATQQKAGRSRTSVPVSTWGITRNPSKSAKSPTEDRPPSAIGAGSVKSSANTVVKTSNKHTRENDPEARVRGATEVAQSPFVHHPEAANATATKRQHRKRKLAKRAPSQNKSEAKHPCQ